MRSVADVIRAVDGDERGLSSYGKLAPVYDFVNAEHFNYDRQEELSLAVADGRTQLVELGCGSGRLLKRVEPAFEETVGIDRSPVMLRRAAERTDESRLIRGDVRTQVLNGVSPDGVVMLGRVFSKLRRDEDVRAFGNATGAWMPSGTRLVFNTFRRQDLVDGMTKTQEWSRGGIEVVRESSTTLLPDIRDGLMRIHMSYELTNRSTGQSASVSEEFTLRGYDVSHIRACLESTPLQVVDVEPNPERSTHFVTVKRR